MKILVLGAGAIGMVMGAFLAKKNHLVCLLGREENISAINKSGIFVKGSWGDHHAGNVKGYTDLSELKRAEEGKDGFDLALLAVKAYDTKTAMEQLCDLFPNPFPLLTFQGGLGNIEQIKGLRGKDTVIAGCVGFTAKRLAPGTVSVSAADQETRVGALQDGIPVAAVTKAVDLLSGAGIPTLLATDIEKVLWHEALFCCALDGLATVLGVAYGFLGEHQASRELISSIVKEFFAVSEKETRQMDWPDPETYLHGLFEAIIPARSEKYPPMLRQVQDGKRTEIDAFNGAVVKIARRHGIDAPINWLIWQLVNAKQKIAAGRKHV